MVGRASSHGPACYSKEAHIAALVEMLVKGNCELHLSSHHPESILNAQHFLNMTKREMIVSLRKQLGQCFGLGSLETVA